MSKIIEEVAGLYKIYALDLFRKTPGVVFDLVPLDLIPRIDSMDRVLHEHSAISPGPVGSIARPWYLHPHQDDNLVVLYGTRFVEIYTPEHGKVEHFTVTPNAVYKNDQLIYEGGAMLVWPVNVFHRIISGAEGSASLNLAVHYEGFDVNTNFSIYDLNTETGEYSVIRRGSEDQRDNFDNMAQKIMNV
jgi:hypothetical protein